MVLIFFVRSGLTLLNLFVSLFMLLMMLAFVEEIIRTGYFIGTFLPRQALVPFLRKWGIDRQVRFTYIYYLLTPKSAQRVDMCASRAICGY